MNPLYLLFFALVLVLTGTTTRAQNGQTREFLRSYQEPMAMEIGFEVTGLAQNRFRSIGSENFTFTGGMTFGDTRKHRWGWRLLWVNVQLSDQTVRDEKALRGVEGNRDHLTGAVSYQRLYVDYYPYRLDLGYARKWGVPIVSFQPVLSVGPGYNVWEFTNYDPGSPVYPVVLGSYELRALTLSLAARLKVVLFDRLFVEYPAGDVFLFLAKNRSSKADLKTVRITRPEAGDALLWGALGVRIPLQ